MAFGWCFFLLAFTASTFAEQVCEYGFVRYFGPLEDDGEEFGFPDVVTSSIRLLNPEGSEATPNDLVVAGRRLTFSPDDWVAAGRTASFIFKSYRESDEISIVKEVSLRTEKPNAQVKVYVSDDGASWVNLREWLQSRRMRLRLQKLGCNQPCNGVAGQYIKIEISGDGNDVPVIEMVSLLVGQAFKDARAPSKLETCMHYRPKTQDVSVGTNVETKKTGDFLQSGSLKFDKDDWAKKKDHAGIEFDFGRKVLLKVLAVTTTGVKYATLYAKDDKKSEYVKSVRQPFLWWDDGIAIRLTDMHDSECSGVAGRFFKLQLHGEADEVPTVSNAHINIVYS